MATVASDTVVDVIVPTATNVVLMVSENISQNLLKRQDANISLPSLYKRAYLIVNETDEIAVLRQAAGG